ncbi:hypothetical protein B7494_g797 [Chlorociboria aeruginascens]|nr:hypothetical protein B7494_g797 [Chlorociboria aeruginascens]
MDQHLSPDAERQLSRFCRQYLQLQRELDYPDGEHLRNEVFQEAINARLFEEDALDHPPPHRYQLRVLKELSARIERSIVDWEEQGISDNLIAHFSNLLISPIPSEATSTQQPSFVTYTLSSYPSTLVQSPLSTSPATSQLSPPTLTLHESRNLLAAAGTTGLRTWEAALHFSTYLVTHPSLIQGQNVLELGSGTGFLSILCAKYLSASHVLCTDGSPSVLASHGTNFYLNSLQDSPLITSSELIWGHAFLGTEELAWNGGQKIDVVIGADVTYDGNAIPALVATFRELMELFPEVKILIGATIRNEITFSGFVDACQRNGLRVDEIEWRVLRKEEQMGPFYEDGAEIKLWPSSAIVASQSTRQESVKSFLNDLTPGVPESLPPPERSMCISQLMNFLTGRYTPTSAPPYLLAYRSSKLFILGTICVAVFSDVFLYGIIVPVMPFSLSERAGVHASRVQSWVSILLAVYGGSLLVVSPVAGWYADRSSSRRAPLLVGLLAAGGATVMLCLARTVALLVVGRILQGVTAGIVWTVGLALLVDTVGKNEIGELFGWVSLSMSIGIVLAPLLAGVVYQRAGYYAVYYMAFGLISLDIVLRLLLVEKKIAKQWVQQETTEEEDIPSSREGGTGTEGEGKIEVVRTTLGEEKDGEVRQYARENEEKSTMDSSASPDIHGRDIAAPRPSSGENAREPNPTIKTPHPPPQTSPRPPKWPPIFTLLKHPRILSALWACVVQASLTVSFDSVLPLFVKHTFGWSSTGAGLIFLAIIIPQLLAPLVGWFSDQYGPRIPTVLGFLLAIPFYVLLRLVTHDSLRQKVLLCALLAFIGLALALVLPPILAEITLVLEDMEKQKPGRFGTKGAYAQGYGLFITAFAAGTLIGPVWAGYVEQEAGWGTAWWSLGLFSAAGAVPCFFYTGGLIVRAKGRVAEHEDGVRTGGSEEEVV